MSENLFNQTYPYDVAIFIMKSAVELVLLSLRSHPRDRKFRHLSARRSREGGERVERR